MKISMVKFHKKGQAVRYLPDGINYKGYLVLFCEIGVSSVNQTAATLDYTLKELIMLPYFDVDKMTDEELVKTEELKSNKEGRLLTIFDIFQYNLEHTLVRFESNARYSCMDVEEEGIVGKTSLEN